MQKRLAARLEKFLAKRKRCINGDYPEVTSRELDELYRIFIHIVRAKWQSDATGSDPVRFAIVNATRERLIDVREPHHATEQATLDMVGDLRAIGEALRLALLDKKDWDGNAREETEWEAGKSNVKTH
jgi:hypothetical protein